jgi:aspartyl-tRNA(Asn)/glutamyl-tRNA(Gln) amidotransferase subunit B
VQQYLGGKQKVLGFFMGQVMKQTKGQAEPKETTALLKKHLETLRD